MGRNTLSRLTGLFGLCAIALLLPGCGQAKNVPVASSATSPPALTVTPAPLPDTPEPPPTNTLSPTATPTSSLYPPSDGIPIHTMDITLNYQDRRMQVAHKVLLENRTFDVWTEVVFSVPPAYTPDVFTFQSAEVTTLRQRQPVTASLQNTMLHVFLPVPVNPGEPVKLNMTYAFQIPYVTPTTWLPEGNLGAGDDVVQAGDWHPTLVPYTSGKGWRTWEYHPVGDPTVYDIANFDIRITADPDLVIAAPGEVAQSDTERYFQLYNARSFAFTASPGYQVIETQADGIPLEVYYLRPYAEGALAARAVLDTASQAIPLFTELYGPYPTTGLVIAQNAYYGSMEYTGFISMSDFAYKTYQKTPTSLLINLTVHEIAHQWWYGAVGNHQVYEPWLDEAFAKYSELLFYENFYPDVIPWWWENHIDKFNPAGPIDATIYEFQSTAEYIHNIYGQSARFMHDLRVLMGDGPFFDFVKAYWEYGQLRIMTREDFFTVLEAHTDEDLTALIEQYFDQG